MLLRKWTGFRSLPSRYGVVDGGFRRSPVETGSSRLPSQEPGNTSGSPMSSSQSLMAAEKSLPSKSPPPFPSQIGGVTAALELSSLQRNPGGSSMKFLHPGSLRAVSEGSQPGTRANDDGIDLPRRLEHSMRPPSSDLGRRRNSFSHLPNYHAGDIHADQPLARKRWSGSQLDLQANFLEETPREVKLREAGGSLAGQPKEFGARNLELEVDMMEFELCALNQKQMESSFAYLEKERKWLEVIRLESRTRKRELDDKIFRMEMELAKTRSCFGKRDHRLLRHSEEHATLETVDVGQELRNLQKSLSALKNCIKTLEEKRNEMVQQLKCVKEVDQSSASHPTATKSLETKRERRQLQAAYKNTKQKNGALLQQVQHLSLELKQAQKNQEESRDQISALRSELASTKDQVDQQEREKVRLKEEMESVRQHNSRMAQAISTKLETNTVGSNEELSSPAAERRQSLATLLEKLHLLEEEEKARADHVRALEDERAQLLEEKEQRLLQRTVELQGQEETRKALQASCENLRESQIQLQKEKGLLQGRCQDLERQAEGLGKQLDEQQSITRDWRNRWEGGDAALKSKEEELEKTRAQNQALQAKNAEWSLEKQRLHELVKALEEQLTQKDQALRDLRQTKEVDRTVLETRTSSELNITRDSLGTSCEKGRPGGLEAKIVGNQLEGLRLQHRSVTEQLKELFRQRQQQQQQQTGAKKHQEKSVAASQNVPRVLGSLGLSSEGSFHLEAGDASKREEEEEESLRQQLEAKSEVISAMACEIQTLKEKNENLMRAKVRFREQIQQIRRVSKQPEEEAPSSSQHAEIQGQSHACTEEERSDTPSNAGMVQRAPSPLLPSDASLPPRGILSSETPWASDRLLLAPAASPKHVEEEGALLSPRSSGLLSPRPFGPPRPWSPFRERDGSPENRREL